MKSDLIHIRRTSFTLWTPLERSAFMCIQSMPHRSSCFLPCKIVFQWNLLILKHQRLFLIKSHLSSAVQFLRINLQQYQKKKKNDLKVLETMTDWMSGTACDSTNGDPNLASCNSYQFVWEKKKKKKAIRSILNLAIQMIDIHRSLL